MSFINTRYLLQGEYNKGKTSATNLLNIQHKALGNILGLELQKDYILEDKFLYDHVTTISQQIIICIFCSLPKLNDYRPFHKSQYHEKKRKTSSPCNSAVNAGEVLSMVLSDLAVKLKEDRRSVSQRNAPIYTVGKNRDNRESPGVPTRALPN